MSDMINDYTKTIKRYESEIQNTYMYIGMNLYELSNLDCFKESEYKNIAEYAYINFGYEKAKTYYIIQIYEKFFMEDMKKHNTLKYKDYSISQLRIMLNFNDEQLKLCDSSMTCIELVELKNKKSTRVDSISVENADFLKNEISGQNVITGVFPDKIESVEDEKEEKQQTIIVSPLPQLPQEVKPEPKIIIEVKQEPEVKPEYFNPHNDSDFVVQKLQMTIENLVIERDKLYEETLVLKEKNDLFLLGNEEKHEVIQYVYKELKKLNINSLDKIIEELYNFYSYGMLPEKLSFMKNVI